MNLWSTRVKKVWNLEFLICLKAIIFQENWVVSLTWLTFVLNVFKEFPKDIVKQMVQMGIYAMVFQYFKFLVTGDSRSREETSDNRDITLYKWSFLGRYFISVDLYILKTMRFNCSGLADECPLFQRGKRYIVMLDNILAHTRPNDCIISNKRS